MKKWLCALGIVCLAATAFAGSPKEKELKREMAMELQAVYEKYKPQLEAFGGKDMKSMGISFPTDPPANALTGTFYTSSDNSKQLQIWIWRERNFVWIKAEPLKGPPSFSSWDFTLIQNDREYDVFPINSSGDYASGSLPTTNVYQLAPAYSDVIPDLQSAFDLEYEYSYSRDPHVFKVPADTGGCTEAELTVRYNAGFAAGQAECADGLYTQHEVDQMIQAILTWGDFNGDGKIGLEEVVNALQITTGLKH
jgi:hypothetical protein